MQALEISSLSAGELQKTSSKDRVAALDLSIIVPVYNSADTVAKLLERLTKTIESITKNYEIILVDDGSRDDSWSVIQSLKEQYSSRLVAVQLMRNYGQHNALMCGLRLAGGAFVITMDDDLQNPPEEIPKLLAHIKLHGLDLVYGCPSSRGHSAWRNLGSSIVWHLRRIDVGRFPRELENEIGCAATVSQGGHSLR